MPYSAQKWLSILVQYCSADNENLLIILQYHNQLLFRRHIHDFLGKKFDSEVPHIQER